MLAIFSLLQGNCPKYNHTRNIMLPLGCSQPVLGLAKCRHAIDSSRIPYHLIWTSDMAQDHRPHEPWEP